jgi:hypothetical protein
MGKAQASSRWDAEAECEGDAESDFRWPIADAETDAEGRRRFG